MALLVLLSLCGSLGLGTVQKLSAVLKLDALVDAETQIELAEAKLLSSDVSPDHTEGTWEYQQNATKDFKCSTWKDNVAGNGCTCDTDSYVSEPEKYEWVPKKCALPEWDARSFCSSAADQHILVIGDSTMQQSYNTLASLIFAANVLSASERKLCLSKIGFYRSDTLDGTAGRGTGDQNKWQTGLNDQEVVPTHLIMTVGAHIANLTTYQGILRGIVRDLDVLKKSGVVNPSLKVMWKTNNPPFGDNTITDQRNHPMQCGSINNVKSMRTDYYSFDDLEWAKQFNYQQMPLMDQFARSFLPAHGIGLIDMKPLHLRGDAHANNDCMHYCLPGPLKLFARLVQNSLSCPTAGGHAVAHPGSKPRCQYSCFV
jgi:hypothetical protein